MDDTKNSTIAIIPKVFENVEKFLVYIAPKGKVFEGKYRLVGGKIKLDENYILALRREFLEEYNISIFKIKLLYKKKINSGGEIFLCSGLIKGTPIRKEDSVGEPEWKSAKELFSSNLVPNGKTTLYCYLLENDLKSLESLIPIIKKDKDFISFLSKEAKDLHSDLITRIRIDSK